MPSFFLASRKDSVFSNCQHSKSVLNVHLQRQIPNDLQREREFVIIATSLFRSRFFRNGLLVKLSPVLPILQKINAFP